MAKDKAVEAAYKAEGKRRMVKRKEIRSLRAAVKRDYRQTCAIWADDNSPTGYSQNCSYRGTCQAPCNGDC